MPIDSNHPQTTNSIESNLNPIHFCPTFLTIRSFPSFEIVHIFAAQQQAPDLSISLRLEELIQKADGDVNLKIRKMLKTVESPLPILLLGVFVGGS